METHIIIEPLPEYWQPTNKLRYLSKQTDPSGNRETVLQQMYTTNLGNKKWEDIPTVRE